MRKYIRWLSLMGLLLGWLSTAQAQAPQALDSMTTDGSWSNQFAPAYAQNQSFAVDMPLLWNNTVYARIKSPPSYGVAFWDGYQWVRLGDFQHRIDAMAVYRDQLYVVGDFDNNDMFRYLAVWNGNTWSIKSDRIEYTFLFSSLETYNDELYLASRNVRINSVSYGSIARWNGTRWAGLGNSFSATPIDLQASPNGLYVAGELPGLVPNNQGGVLRWDGTQWSSLANGLRGTVVDLRWVDNQLYVSGNFTSTVSPAINNIAAWDGTTWNGLNGGIDFKVISSIVIEQQLYAISEAPNSTYALHRWDGINWQVLNQSSRFPDNDGPRHVSLLSYQNQLHAIGNIEVVNPATPTALPWASTSLRWDSNGWQAMQPLGFNGNLASIAATGETLYAYNAQGLSVGQPSAASLLKLAPNSQWQTIYPASSTLSLTPSHQLDPMVVMSNTLYLGNATGLYQTRDTAWELIADVYVTSLVADQNRLYVAGDFDVFNGLATDNLVMWDGSAWHAFELPATFSHIQVLDVYHDVIYISDGQQLARWDSGQWQLLATNVASISLIEAAPDGVYIAGSFSSVDGVFAYKLARWRNAGWSNLGGYIDGPVYDLELGPDGLYVAGSFYGISQSIGGPTLVASSGILRWNNEWFGVGGGVQKRHGPPNTVIQVYQLVTTNDRMYLSGVFDTVGHTYRSSQIAAWQYGNSALLYANGDYASTYRPHAVAINVLDNDWGYPPQNIELIAVSNGSQGTAIVSGNQVIYTPDATFSGSDVIEYTIRDSVRAITSSAGVQISVLEHVPTIAPLTITVQPNSTTMIDVLDGVIDLNGDPLTITQASASFGTVAIVNNQLQYTIANVHRFYVTINYTVSDGHGEGTTAKVLVLSAAKYAVYAPLTVR